jgi:NAD(P)-dependent dehydrogenase (short-subunit alcohol dehydrogenase family)
MKLEERVAIVTGAASGIGRAIALELAREGADVVVADIKSEQAEKVVYEIKALGHKAKSFKADVSKNNQVNLMAKTVLDEFGKIDILVNNAGGSARKRATLFCESTEEVWDYVINLNLKGVLNCSRAVIEHMIQSQSGKIVNISAIAGIIGEAGLVDYSAAKAGIVGFTKALAKEVAPHGINVNCVAPGPIETEALRATLPDNRLAHFRKITGLGRLGRPEEVCSLVVFLTTDEANFITGQVFPICGLMNLGT